MSSKKWSSQELITSIDETTMLCVINKYGTLTPKNNLVKVSDLGLLNKTDPTVNNSLKIEGSAGLTINGYPSSINLSTNNEIGLMIYYDSDNTEPSYGTTIESMGPINVMSKDITFYTNGNARLDCDQLNILTKKGYSMFMDISGRTMFGTGTTAPSAKVHIDNETSSYNFLVENKNNSSSSKFIINNNGSVMIGTDSDYSSKLAVQGHSFLSGGTDLIGNLNIDGNITSNGNINALYYPTYEGEGTVSIAQGSYTINGVGTNFMTFSVNDTITISNPPYGFYMGGITSISSDTLMTVSNASSRTISNHAYGILPADTNIITTNVIKNKSTSNSITLNGDILPTFNAFQNIGSASVLWNTIYASTGSINTSDARLKTEIKPFTQDELNASIQIGKEIGTFKFLESINQKDENARTHIGLTVQRAIEIMKNNNLNPFDYGFICYDKWDAITKYHSATEEKEAYLETIRPAGDLYSFRYTELLTFIARGFEERLTLLENK